jgi:hypothetical protein
MQRLAYALVASVCVSAVAACGDDGSPTGSGTLTYLTPSIQASYAQPSKATDGAGATVLIWKIELSHAAQGTGCKADSFTIDASIGIFTSQVPDSSHTVAQLTTGDISIVTTAPPVAPTDGEVANMGATGVSGLEGTVSISGVGKSADGKTVTGITGTITAGGTDGNGNPVTLTGMFDAPLCE